MAPAVDATQLNLKRRFVGTQSLTRRYEPGDVVLDNGGSYYICITANTNEDASASTSGNWQLFNPLRGPVVVFQAAITPATDGTAVGTAFNTLRTNLIAAGVMAAS